MPISIRSSDITQSPKITRLRLTNFRNYNNLKVEIINDRNPGNSCVLYGDNGAGKTNFLEAISLLAPGNGLRRQRYQRLANNNGDGSWAVAARIENNDQTITVGTGMLANSSDNQSGKRKIRIDHKPVKQATKLLDYLRVIWLTPSDEALFNAPASTRRDFLDRFIATLDSKHNRYLRLLNQAIRQRKYALIDPHTPKSVLDNLEQQISKYAISIAELRNKVINQLQPIINQDWMNPFPWGQITIDGLIENMLSTWSAPIVDEKYQAILRDNRRKDAARGKTSAGAHLTDFSLKHGPKQAMASQSSSGEQKALLIRLFIGYGILLARHYKKPPILLLDEIACHLDSQRRNALFTMVENFGFQTFMTGTDHRLFSALADKAKFFSVSDGNVSTSIL